MADKIKVAVLMGGPSAEHDISLKTGRNVLVNLDDKKYEGKPVVVSREGGWEIPPPKLKHLADVVFIAMHGDYGEDGTVQAELEFLGIPYTGSDSFSSAFGMNKFLSLQFLRDAGFDVPYTMLVHKINWLDDPYDTLAKINLYIERPWVIKPNRGGSSLDVVITDDINDLQKTMFHLFKKYPDLIIQPFVRGKEVTCGVLDWGLPGSAYALPPTEIVPRKGNFFDYKSKYEPEGALEITPARLPNTKLEEIKRIAKDIHIAMNLRGMSRTDMIVGEDGRTYILEVNTIPGLTETSLLPKAANAVGISFSELINRIIRSALQSW